MMKHFDIDRTKRHSDFVKIVPGAYVCKVLKVKIEQYGNSEQLKLMFDITEGDFAGYYDAQYKASTYDDKKYKGVLPVWIPKDDGSDLDEYTKRSFTSMVCDFEDSNKGFAWDWDEKKLIGKSIGIVIGERESKNEPGKVFVVPCYTCTVEKARSGKVNLPKVKTKAATEATETYSDSDDLPF